jgi:hypothetical protein
MKVPLPRSLRFRLVFKQTLSFALLVTLLAWGAYAFLARRMSTEFDGELQDRSIAVRSMLNIRDGQVRWLNKEADPEVRDQFERSVRFYQVLDDQARPLESAREWPVEGPEASAKAKETIATGRITWEDVSAPNGRLRVLNAPVSGPRRQTYVLRIGMSMAGVDEDTFYLRLMHVIVLAFLVLVHAVNSWIIAGKALRPLEQLAAAAEQITPQDREKRLPTFGNGDELDELSRVLNQTLGKLQASVQRMTDFLRSLSHEIRQPLTVMRAETEQALRMSQGDENAGNCSVSNFYRTRSPIFWRWPLLTKRLSCTSLLRTSPSWCRRPSTACGSNRTNSTSRFRALFSKVSRAVLMPASSGVYSSIFLKMLLNSIGHTAKLMFHFQLTMSGRFSRLATPVAEFRLMSRQGFSNAATDLTGHGVRSSPGPASDCTLCAP